MRLSTIAVALLAVAPAVALAGDAGSRSWNADEQGVVLGG